MKNKDAHLYFKVDLDDAGMGMTEAEKKSKNFMANWLSKAETTKRKSQHDDDTKKNEEEDPTTSTKRARK